MLLDNDLRSLRMSPFSGQPGDLAAVRYSQGLLAITSQHRMSFGVGVVDVLPGIDLDLMAGGVFRDIQQLGACKRLPAPDSWSSAMRRGVPRSCLGAYFT